jgi:hypothetical protein
MTGGSDPGLPAAVETWRTVAGRLSGIRHCHAGDTRPVSGRLNKYWTGGSVCGCSEDWAGSRVGPVFAEEAFLSAGGPAWSQGGAAELDDEVTP